MLHIITDIKIDSCIHITWPHHVLGMSISYMCTVTESIRLFLTHTYFVLVKFYVLETHNKLFHVLLTTDKCCKYMALFQL